MVVLNKKFDIVLELFFQRVSSLCIDCSKIDKLRVSLNMHRLLLSGGNLWSILFDYEVELYFRISNPKFRKQTLMIFVSRPRLFK